MASVNLSPIHNEFIEYLVTKMTPQEILAFKVSEKTQMRVDELTERNKADKLVSDEALELEQILEFDLLISVLKAKAAKGLNKWKSGLF